MIKDFIISIIKNIASLLPAEAPDFIYTVLLKPRILRHIANTVLSSLIPNHITIPEGIILLNKSDPVVSGALMLGVYEKFETELIRKTLKPGMVIIDIGAHIGYYTVIAARIVGDGGQVIAFEPDTENFSFLEHTIKTNGFTNVSIHRMGISNKSGDTTLFVSPRNSGDHRIYQFSESRERIVIPLTTIDAFVKNHRLERIDFIKMDIQGAEGKALDGMQNTLKTQNSITLITEFWPQGIRAAGNDPLHFLQTLQSIGFSIIQIQKNISRPVVGTDLQNLIDALPGRKYTNLLCIKNH